MKNIELLLFFKKNNCVYVFPSVKYCIFEFYSKSLTVVDLLTC